MKSFGSLTTLAALLAFAFGSASEHAEHLGG